MYMIGISARYLNVEIMYITGISARYHKFLQNQMNQAVKGDSKLLKYNLIPTLRDILTYL
ncbi:hypothetical protein VTO42DRAFT_1132 [Malbranchea cinnamomea]